MKTAVAAPSDGPERKHLVLAVPQLDGSSEVVEGIGFDAGDPSLQSRFFVFVDPVTGEHLSWHCVDPGDVLLEEPSFGLDAERVA